MCDCFDEKLEAVKAAASEQLKDAPMVEGSFESKWRNGVFFLDGKPNAPVALYIDSEYRPLKKDGTPAKSKKKLESGFKMAYCPFCGEKYE